MNDKVMNIAAIAFQDYKEHTKECIKNFLTDLLDKDVEQVVLLQMDTDENWDYERFGEILEICRDFEKFRFHIGLSHSFLCSINAIMWKDYESRQDNVKLYSDLIDFRSYGVPVRIGCGRGRKGLEFSDEASFQSSYMEKNDEFWVLKDESGESILKRSGGLSVISYHKIMKSSFYGTLYKADKKSLDLQLWTEERRFYPVKRIHASFNR